MSLGEMYRDGTYLQHHPNWHTEDAEWKASHVREMLARHNLSPRSVIEVGCGAGEILRVLAHSDPTGTYNGYEASPDAFAMCSARAAPNLTFHQRDLLAVDATADLLLCLDVIEHVEDYIGFIRQLRGKADWKLFHVPLEVNVSTVLRDSMMESRRGAGHLHYFTRDTAIAALCDVGYQIVESSYTRLWIGRPARTRRSALAQFPRTAIYALSPDLCVRTIGGCSLMVLAR